MPIRNRGETPYLMVNFPDRKQFDQLYAKVYGDNKDKYWNILTKRSQGASLEESGKLYALSRERVRQIEAKFIRLVGGAYWTEVDVNIGLTQHFEQNTFLMLEKQGTSLPEDGNH